MISTYLRLRQNIQTQATPLVTGIEQRYDIINVTINNTSKVTIIFFAVNSLLFATL